jgi:hypothetical protein
VLDVKAGNLSEARRLLQPKGETEATNIALINYEERIVVLGLWRIFLGRH